MNITLAQYIGYDGQNMSILIIVDGNRLFVPLDPANSDYAEIMRQVEDGSLVISPAEGEQ